MTSIEYQKLDKNKHKLAIDGQLNTDAVGQHWRRAVKQVTKEGPEVLIVDAGGVDYCDGAGVALLLQLKAIQERNSGSIQIEGLKPEFEQLLKLFDPGEVSGPERRPILFVRFLDSVGRTAVRLVEDFKAQVCFSGEIFVKLLGTILRPGSLRLKDTLVVAEKSGANAIGITALLGFLIGLILAFQSAIAMRKFGAEIFVADLVIISLFRELGPLLTAFILASRSGSAFAAELGTMKVNEEIDALITMGLDPVRFLAIPRVIAAVVIMPLLTMFNNFFGLVGCALVMISFGFAPVAILTQMQQAAGVGDLFGGLFKTLVFGLLIAGIGCLRGLQTGKDASAVGDSATSAVVSSIVAIVAADGVFAVVYYFLGI